jgi:hypothetical protein
MNIYELIRLTDSNRLLSSVRQTLTPPKPKSDEEKKETIQNGTNKT